MIASEQHKNLLEVELQQAAQQSQLDLLTHQHQKNMLLLLSVGACLALALLLSLVLPQITSVTDCCCKNSRKWRNKKLQLKMNLSPP